MAVKKAAVKAKEPKLRFTVNHALSGIYVTLLFTFFPLFLSNYYSAARRDKFWSFVVITGIMGLVVGIIALVNYLTKDNYYNQKLNTYRDPFRLNTTDIAFAAFVLISLVSSLLSGRFAHCFLGLSGKESNGRNMGLLMILLLFVCYMIISRYFYSKKFIYYAIFFGITVVSVIAIFNYYKVDVLGIFAKYKSNENVYQNFTSTIGNKNYLSALICVALPFSVGMAISSDDLVLRIVSYVSTFIQFMGLIVATSDGGFLGCLAAVAVILILSSRSIKKFTRFFLCLTLMMAGAKFIWLVELMTKGGSKGYTSFSQFFVYSPVVFVIMGVSALIFAALFLGEKNGKIKELPKAVFFVCLSLTGLAVLAFTALLIYYSCIDTETKLTGMMRFFRFDERWGTHRGYFWINSFEVYGDKFSNIKEIIIDNKDLLTSSVPELFSNLSEVIKIINDIFIEIKNILFGTGPETFYYSFKPYFNEMVRLFNESSTNSAHNVYINYLITHGALGLAAYLTFVGSALVSTFRRAKNNPLAFVCAGVILAYAVQDIVNIANPVNTPWFIVFIALSEATRLRANSEKELANSKF